MKITVLNEATGETLSVDLPASLSVADFQVYLEAETSIAPGNQILVKDGSVVDVDLTGTKTIDTLNLQDDDLVILKDKSVAGSSGPVTGPSSSSSSADPEDAMIEDLRTKILSDPVANAQFEQQSPGLHGLLHQPDKFKQALKESIRQYSGGYNHQQQEELRRLQQNPDDPNNQARILELIQQEQIEENYKLAYDISPESFTSVNMLYIKVVINGHTIQAFVDSGAQVTIMAPKLAERLGITRLIDKRFIHEVRGVGSSMTLGKIHSVPISVGDSDVALPCAFTVVDTQHDILFGLDMLRRHRCIIDLERDVLVVGGSVETKFLHELVVKHKEIAKSEHVLGGGAPTEVTGSNGGATGSSSSKSASGSGSGSGSAVSAAAQAALNRQTKFKKEDIERLIDFGFSRDQAIQALEACQGNVEMAASMLFQ